MKIQVKQEHIDRGERFSSERCPVALAIQEVSSANVSVGVTKSTLWTWDPLHVADVALPVKVQNFICDFDARKPVEPFEFEFPL